MSQPVPDISQSATDVVGMIHSETEIQVNVDEDTTNLIYFGESDVASNEMQADASYDLTYAEFLKIRNKSDVESFLKNYYGF